MAAVGFEINSFLEKFALMARQDINANLHFNSYEGKIFVSLQAELGQFRPINYSRSGSRSRRRKRRKAVVPSQSLSEVMRPSTSQDVEHSAPLESSHSASESNNDISHDDQNASTLPETSNSTISNDVSHGYENLGQIHSCPPTFISPEHPTHISNVNTFECEHFPNADRSSIPFST